MNIDSVRDERIPGPEQPLREKGDWAKVEMGADHVLRSRPQYCAECRDGKPRCANGADQWFCTRQVVAVPASAAVVLSEQPQLVAKLAQTKGHVPAESSDATAEPGERWRPEMEVQDGRGWGCRGTATARRSVGIVQRPHAHLHP